MIKFNNRKPNLKRDKFIKGDKKETLISKSIDSVRENIEFLNKVNYNLSENEVKIIMSILIIAGIMLGLIMKNPYISFILTFLFPVSYLEFLNFQKNQVALRIEKQIIKYSELIKNSYLATHDIRRSIKENMDRFEEPIKTLFTEFITEVEIYNYYPKDAILNMNKKIQTPSLKKLTEQLSLCEEDRRFDVSLEATAALLGDRKSFLTSWEYKANEILRTFIVLLLLINGLFAFMLFGYGDIGIHFIQSVLFKPMIAIFILLQGVSTLLVLRRINSINI